MLKRGLGASRMHSVCAEAGNLFNQNLEESGDFQLAELLTKALMRSACAE